MERHVLNPKKIIKGIKKRNGDIVPLDESKINAALYASFAEIAAIEKKEIDEAKINHLTTRVLEKIAAEGMEYPSVDYINQKDVEVMKDHGFLKEAIAFENYSKRRTWIREELKVSKVTDGSGDSTDNSLLVEGEAKATLLPWDRKMIEYALQRECGIDLNKARKIAKNTEKNIFDLGLKSVTTDLIRELNNVHLIEIGEEARMKKQQVLGMPTYDLEQLIFAKSKENSNIAANNPEAINLAIAETTLKKYALENVFSEDVAKAHLSGRFHLHDLGYPIRTYCSSHSLEYIKKYGLNLENLTIKSSSATHTGTLTGHLNTFLASMQAYYAGALGIGYMNIFYAPLLKADLEGKSKKERKEFMKQQAQYLIFSLSQSAFSRGGQVLFIDANVHTGVPTVLKEVPAIGPKGKYQVKRKKTLDEIVDASEEELKDAKIYKIKLADDEGDVKDTTYYATKIKKDDHEKFVYLGKMPENEKNRLYFLNKKELIKKEDGKMHFVQEYDDIEMIKDIKRDEKGDAIDPEDGTVVRYNDFKQEVQEFAEAMLEVWKDGDRDGKVFSFPKCDMHINSETFSDPSQKKLFDYACEVASENGSPYFFFDREETQLSQCCRLRTTITDQTMIKYPERLRFCGFQNVTINLPQAAYRAGKNNLEGMINDIGESMELAVKAHLQKKEFVKKIMDNPAAPLWQVGKKMEDGKPYVDLDNATYIMGIVGLNEAMQYITGKELHEDLNTADKGTSFNQGLKVIAAMNIKTKDLAKKYNLKLALEESPAESTTRRLVKIDLAKYPEQTRSVVKGNIDADETYYTNSIHFKADAPISLTDRINYQSKFHSLIESGAIIHAFVGESRPSSESIGNLVKKTYENTNCAQFVISPEFTYCNSCHGKYAGLLEKCTDCGSENVERIARIVGYFSRTDNWNKSKQGELKDRQKAKDNYVPANA